jgi:branched-chain amino acid transport system permease protein
MWLFGARHKRPGLARITPLALLLTLGAIAGLILLPFALDNYLMRLATTILMYAALAWGWNFIGGYVGYPSFGTAGFFGLGAYTGAILLTHKLVPFWLSPISAAVTCTILAFAIGAPILRLRGHYFAVASLSIGEVLRQVTSSWTDLTGGGMGVNLPPMLGSVIGEARFFYYTMLILAGVCFAVTVLVSRSWFGVALRCIRQNEEAANMIGIDPLRYKVTAFALSAALPGAAGAVYASWIGYIEPSDAFDLVIAIKAPIVVLLGGAGTVFGPLLGAVVYLVFEEIVWSNLLSFHNGMLGIIVVLLVLFMPHGGIDLLRRRAHAQAAQ